MAQAEDEGRRRGIRQVDQVRPRRRVLEVEGEELGRRQRAAGVGVGEDWAAVSGVDEESALSSLLAVKGPEHVLALIVDVQRLNDAVHARGRGERCTLSLGIPAEAIPIPTFDAIAVRAL